MIRAARRAGLDPAGVRRHGNVGNGGVLGFAGTMAADGGVSVRFGRFKAIARFSERAGWVYGNKDRIGHSRVNAVAQEFRVGYKNVGAGNSESAVNFQKQQD